MADNSGLLVGLGDDPISSGAYAGVCVRQEAQYNSGFCLLLGAGLNGGPALGWVLQQGSNKRARTMGTVLASGSVPQLNLYAWHHLQLNAVGHVLQASINGSVVATVPTPGGLSGGLASLRTGYHFAYFDNLLISGIAPPASALLAGTTPRSCTRSDFTGLVGAQMVATTALQITALGRFVAGPGSVPVQLFVDGHLQVQATAPDGPVDALGFVYAPVNAVAVAAGQSVRVVMSVQSGGVLFCDDTTSGVTSALTTDLFAVYQMDGVWYNSTVGGVYGPVNAIAHATVTQLARPEIPI